MKYYHYSFAYIYKLMLLLWLHPKQVISDIFNDIKRRNVKVCSDFFTNNGGLIQFLIGKTLICIIKYYIMQIIHIFYL